MNTKLIAIFMMIGAISLSSCRDIFEENIEGNLVNIEFPQNQQELVNNQVTFTWNEVEGASRYRINIVSTRFTNIEEFVVRDTMISGESFTYLFRNTGEYEWSIQAINSGFESKIEINSFSINAILTDTTDDVAPIAPIIGSSIVDTTSVKLSWSRVNTNNDIAFDSVFVSTDPLFDPTIDLTIIKRQVAAETLELFPLAESTDYFWRVKSIDRSGNNSSYSLTRSFKSGRWRKVNKKKVNYILIPLVLLIWGGIIYTAINGLSNDDNQYIINKALPEVKMDQMEVDSFTLLANYRDPFLKRRYYSTTSTKNVSSITNRSKPTTNLKKTSKVEKKETMNWNFISYHGQIKNQKTAKNVGMLTIKGKDYLVNEGETIEEIKLVKLLEDSVKVSYKENYAYIKKN